MIAPIRTALVLAGRRDGTVDPFAADHGVQDKCLIPVAGLPMITHIVTSLWQTKRLEHILISSNDADAIRTVPVVARLEREGRLGFVAADDNIAGSVLKAARRAEFPLLVTTADNCLFDSSAITEFGVAAHALDSDIAVGFAPKDAILSAHPDGQRKFYQFSDMAVSTCNAYWIRNREALGAVETFRGGGQFVRHPLRIAQAFGIWNLIRFRFGMGTLEAAFRRFSRRFRLDMRAILLTNGACAIDVDNERTLRVTEEILAQRAEPLLTGSAREQQFAVAARLSSV
ncbi:spore coat biosynthesis protein F [Pacificimonas sp. ICDLI1SI03]